MGRLLDVASVTGSTMSVFSQQAPLLALHKLLNFVGTGNTFLDKGDGTIDVAISGSGGGGLELH